MTATDNELVASVEYSYIDELAEGLTIEQIRQLQVDIKAQLDNRIQALYREAAFLKDFERKTALAELRKKAKSVVVKDWSGKSLTVLVVPTNEGTDHEISNRCNEKHTIKIDRAWDVEIDGVTIGKIEFRMTTRETRSKGNRYVNSRWESPSWRYLSADHAGKFDRGYWPESSSKIYAIEQIVSAYQRRSK